ncbi:MAG: peptide chain release factor N(5)-glutamine methyltransferase [Solirubrobacteraceae bacterium]
MPPADFLATRPRTVGFALAGARDRLAAAGCDTPRLDAEVLLAEVLGVGRERLVLDRDEALSQPAAARFTELLARRAQREPVAYILGRRDFRRLTLAVDPRVLIPRPETELLVEVGLELAPGARVLEVGTGSGAVALALKDERPDLRVRGTDLSADALAVARGNAQRLGLDVDFAVADLLDAAPADAVLANLPYVPAGTALAPEIARYEPAGALFAGADGLDAVRRLIARLPGRTVMLAALEVAPDQAGAVAGMLAASGWRTVDVRRDLAGGERVVVGSA